MRPTGYGSILSLVPDTAQGGYTAGLVPRAAYEAALSNWGPPGTIWAEYHAGSPYRLVSGPIHTPPGAYPIRRIRRQLADDRIR